jgi:hypothetical protein
LSDEKSQHNDYNELRKKVTYAKNDDTDPDSHITCRVRKVAQG